MAQSVRSCAWLLGRVGGLCLSPRDSLCGQPQGLRLCLDTAVWVKTIVSQVTFTGPRFNGAARRDVPDDGASSRVVVVAVAGADAGSLGACVHGLTASALVHEQAGVQAVP